MSKLPLTQSQNMALGLFIADAASIGFHWIYDFDHLQKIASKNPVFKTPLFKNYEGIFGFFAHEKKLKGDFSHYGETALLVLQNLNVNNEKFDLLNYQKIYREYFGAGGDYIGYIDSPTRITLENLVAADYEVARITEKSDYKLQNEIVKVVLQKVLPYTRIYQGDELIVPITDAISVTYDDPKILEFALKIAQRIDNNRLLISGADDQQLPALASAALFACYFKGENFNKSLKSAVRVTNNNQNAVDAAFFIAELCQLILCGKDIDCAIEVSQSNQTEFIKQCIGTFNKIKHLSSLKEASEQSGRTCYLNESIPLSLWILSTSNSYEEAITLNVLVGGDSCGRSYIVGSIAGGYYWNQSAKGIPFDWVAKMNKLKEVSQLI